MGTKMQQEGSRGQETDAAAPELCSNCGQPIGRLEKAYLWQQNTVCQSCHQRLSENAEVPPSGINSAPNGRIWSVHDQGRQFGPHTEQEIATLVAVGTISPLAMVWRGGSPRWIPVSNIVPAPASRSMAQPPSVVVNVNQNNTTAALPASPIGGSGLIAAGYICAFVSLLFCPPGFGIAGVVIGIVNITRGHVGHGVAQIVISIFCTLLGIAIGVAAWS